MRAPRAHNPGDHGNIVPTARLERLESQRNPTEVAATLREHRRRLVLIDEACRAQLAALLRGDLKRVEPTKLRRGKPPGILLCQERLDLRFHMTGQVIECSATIKMARLASSSQPNSCYCKLQFTAFAKIFAACSQPHSFRAGQKPLTRPVILESRETLSAFGIVRFAFCFIRVNPCLSVAYFSFRFSPCAGNVD